MATSIGNRTSEGNDRYLFSQGGRVKGGGRGGGDD